MYHKSGEENRRRSGMVWGRRQCSKPPNLRDKGKFAPVAIDNPPRGRFLILHHLSLFAAIHRYSSTGRVKSLWAKTSLFSQPGS